MSIKGDRMKATPAAKKPAWTARVKAGAFLICSQVLSTSAARPDIVILVDLECS